MKIMVPMHLTWKFVQPCNNAQVVTTTVPESELKSPTPNRLSRDRRTRTPRRRTRMRQAVPMSLFSFTDGVVLFPLKYSIVIKGGIMGVGLWGL